MTALWQMVESLQLELASLRTNITLSDAGALATANQVDSMGTDMDAMWLMLGSILVVCELLICRRMRSIARGYVSVRDHYTSRGQEVRAPVCSSTGRD